GPLNQITFLREPIGRYQEHLPNESHGRDVAELADDVLVCKDAPERLGLAQWEVRSPLDADGVLPIRFSARLVVIGLIEGRGQGRTVRQRKLVDWQCGPGH